MTQFKLSKTQLCRLPALSDHHDICSIFRTNHISPQRSIKFRDFREANTELLASNIKMNLSHVLLLARIQTKMLFIWHFFLKKNEQMFPNQTQNHNTKAMTFTMDYL